MRMLRLRAAMLGVLLAGTTPALAQSAVPPVVVNPAKPDRWGDPTAGGGMFAGMSEAGRTTVREAMRAGGGSRADRDAVKVARDRMLVLLDAEPLDMAALKRTMEDESRAAQASHDRRQAAMLAGMTKLSVADRKVFVANMRAMKARMEARVGQMKRRGHGGGMPPPLL